MQVAGATPPRPHLDCQPPRKHSTRRQDRLRAARMCARSPQLHRSTPLLPPSHPPLPPPLWLLHLPLLLLLLHLAGTRAATTMMTVARTISSSNSSKVVAAVAAVGVAVEAARRLPLVNLASRWISERRSAKRRTKGLWATTTEKQGCVPHSHAHMRGQQQVWRSSDAIELMVSLCCPFARVVSQAARKQGIHF